MEERISREEFVRIYNIELTFLDSLEDFGLLHPQVENEVKYILFSDLPTVERYANWYYDLEVNMPGIEVINNLLQKIEALHSEKRRLLQQLHFRTQDWEDAEF